jgi:hypothetical protein
LAFLKISDFSGAKRVMIFAEGTILKPKSWLCLYNHNSYIPIGKAVDIIKDWQQQGADIIYCTSRRGKQAKNIAKLLLKYGFVGSKLYYREKAQNYKNIVETVRPDVLIEDNCMSIGGSWQMCITHVEPQIRNTIKSIVVKEFMGIDCLPHDLQKLCCTLRV